MAHDTVSEETTGQRWIRTQLAGPATVLMLAHPQVTNSSQYGQEIVTTVAPVRESVLVISCSGSPKTWLHDWTSQLSYVPNNVRIIHLSTEQDQSSNQELAVITPDDLSTLESRITQFLRQTHESGTQPILLFDSLSALFASAEEDVCQTFLNRVLDESKTFEAFAFFHLDPTDESIQELVEDRFDATAELLSEESRWRVY